MASVNHKAVYILGPKGFGKTTALLELHRTRSDSLYIDLATKSKASTASLPSASWLLLDNAQDYTEELKPLLQNYRTIIAAFSPGVRVNMVSP